MVTYNLTDAITPDEVIISISSAVPIFPIMLLVFIWLLVFLGGVQKQSSKSLYADAPQWAVIASMACLLLSLVMTMAEGIIGLPILLIVVAVTVLSGVWFFLSRGRFE